MANEMQQTCPGVSDPSGCPATGQLFARMHLARQCGNLLPRDTADLHRTTDESSAERELKDEAQNGLNTEKRQDAAGSARDEVAAWRVDSISGDGGVALQLMLDDDDEAGATALMNLRQQLSQTEGYGSDYEDEEDRELRLAAESAGSTTKLSAAQQGAVVVPAPQNIVMLVVGTRGDVQPFIGIGAVLKSRGHRVRLASHAIYREFVENSGLEFFPLGGDPRVLSEFVVKHRGVNPGLNMTDIVDQRKQVRLIIESTWPACTEPDPGPEPGASTPGPAFRADIIVSNPPTYGHLHCAEKLKVPLHVVFTMPWTPTEVFAQPFARVMGTSTRHKKHGPMTNTMNWFSYFAMEDLTWMGMRDIISSFRTKTLGLGRFTKYTNSHGLYHSKVPFTYIWSPSLVPRPHDWRSNIHVVGFVNVDVQGLTKYTPPADLVAFLEAGPPPVYIGFGSLVMNNPKELTRQALAAIKETGVRAIIQKGWGGLGEGLVGDKLPSNIFLLENAAHDWLFARCQAVVHHGGAGTTATGLYAARPTFIVTFFGDQPFWGMACASCGVGPECVTIDQLTDKKLTEAIRFMLKPSCQEAAAIIAEKMRREDGAGGAADHILQTLRDSRLPGYKLRYVRKGRAGRVVPDVADADDSDDSEDDDTGLDMDARPTYAGNKLLGVVQLPRSLYEKQKSALKKVAAPALGLIDGSGSKRSKPGHRRNQSEGAGDGTGSGMGLFRRRRASVSSLVDLERMEADTHLGGPETTQHTSQPNTSTMVSKGTAAAHSRTDTDVPPAVAEESATSFASTSGGSSGSLRLTRRTLKAVGAVSGAVGTGGKAVGGVVGSSGKAVADGFMKAVAGSGAVLNALNPFGRGLSSKRSGHSLGPEEGELPSPPPSNAAGSPTAGSLGSQGLDFSPLQNGGSLHASGDYAARFQPNSLSVHSLPAPPAPVAKPQQITRQTMPVMPSYPMPVFAPSASPTHLAVEPAWMPLAGGVLTGCEAGAAIPPVLPFQPLLAPVSCPQVSTSPFLPLGASALLAQSAAASSPAFVPTLSSAMPSVAGTSGAHASIELSAEAGPAVAATAVAGSASLVVAAAHYLSPGPMVINPVPFADTVSKAVANDSHATHIH